MKFKPTYTSAAYFVVALLVLSVSLLAYLQFVWLGQLGEEEYARMQNTLRNAAFRFSFDFDQEVVDIIAVTGGSLIASESEAIAEIRSRVHHAQLRSLHPKIIHDSIALVDLPRRELTIPLRIDEENSVFILKDLSGFAIPIINSAKSVLVRFDHRVLRETYLPELVRTHFEYNGVLDYDVVVMNSANQIYYSTSQQNASPLPTPDVDVPFFSVPDFPVGKFIADRPPDPPFGEGERDRRFERPFDERGREPGFQRGAPRPERSRFNRRNALLILQVKHRDGSLQASVDRNRWRNLGVSASILLLLGTSVVFLVIAAGRSHKLAQQQLEFVAGVSHELRTPLAVLKSAGENLADGVIQNKDRAQEYGRVITHEVGRLSEMVEKALLYAGIQSGKRVYSSQPVDMAALLDEVVFKVRERAKDITIEATIDPELPLVPGDADALHSLLDNLITNAVKYGGTERWVGVIARTIHKTQSASVEIAVRDKGIGIPQQDMQDVFRSFHRGSNARDAQIEGSGLGLSVARHIIEAHNGSITVKSELNKGTEFIVRIPAIQESRANT